MKDLMDFHRSEEHCWGNHQYFFKNGKCTLDIHFCEDGSKCYLVTMKEFHRLEMKENGMG